MNKEFTYEEFINNDINLNELENFKIKTLNSVIDVTIMGKDVVFDFSKNDETEIKKFYNYFKNKGYNVDGITIKFPNMAHHLRYVDTDYTFLDELSKSVKMFIRFSANELVEYGEYRTFTGNIKWYKDIINETELSPVEKLLYAYDILKTYNYTKEDSKEDESISRTAYKVINSGKIVCVGYTEILNEVLANLDPNVKSSNFIIDCYDKDGKFCDRHMRSAVRIDDDKYDIHGVYALDSTWDSARDSNDYKYFLIPFANYKDVFKYDTLPHFFVRDMHTMNDKFDVEKIKEKLKQENIEEQFLLDDYVLNGLFDGVKTQKEKLKYFLCEPISLGKIIKISVNVRMAQGYSEKDAWDSVANIGKNIEKRNR